MKAAVDLMGDGQHEIIFQGIAGDVEDRVSYWVMEGPARVGGGRLAPDTVSPGWTIFGAAPIQVEPPLLEIVSVEAINDITVDFGTPFADLPLPEEVEVNLSDDSTMDVDVDWTGAEQDYDGDTADTYALEGDLVLPEGVINPDDLKAEVNVIVGPGVSELKIYEDGSDLEKLVGLKAGDTGPEEFTLSIFNESPHTAINASVQLVIDDPDGIEVFNETEALGDVDVQHGDYGNYVEATFDLSGITLEEGTYEATVTLDADNQDARDVPYDVVVGPDPVTEALEDLKDNTTLALSHADNVITATITSPATVDTLLEDYMTDALITADDEFVAGAEITVEYDGTELGTAKLTADTDEIYLSALLDLIEDFTGPTRTPITGHSGEHVWTFTIASPVDVETDLTVASVVSDDGFSTEFELTSDTAALDFNADEDMAIAKLVEDTSLTLEADLEGLTAEINYPAVISNALEDYETDAFIKVVKGQNFRAGTQITFTYNDTVLGTAELTSEKSEMYLSDLLILAGVDPPNTRTSITGHAGLVDEWEFTIVPTEDMLSTIKVSSVVSEDFTVDEISIASDEVVYASFKDDVQSALQDLKDDTELTLDASDNLVTATVDYPAEIDTLLDDYMTDALITAEDAFFEGTEITVEYNGQPLGTAILDVDYEEIYLSDLLKLVEDFTGPTLTPITGHAGLTDIWEFTIDSPVDVDTNLNVASIVSEDFDNKAVVTIADDDEALGFLADEEMARDKLIAETSMTLYADGNVVTADIEYPEEISQALAGYETDAFLEVTAGGLFLVGNQIEVSYNGKSLGTATLDGEYGAMYLSELLNLIPGFTGPIRTSITGHADRTDTWVLTISTVEDILSRIRVTSQVSTDDFTTTYDLDSKAVDLNIDAVTPVQNVTQGTFHYTIQDAIDEAVEGDTIEVGAGTYVEEDQIVIDKDLTIVGEDKETTIIKPAQDTGTSGDDRGWFLVEAGNEFNLSNVTLDGEGKDMVQAIRSNGTGTIENNIIKNITGGGGAMSGVVMFDNMTIKDNEFENIGRVGIWAFGDDADNVVITGNTYTGKGDGTHLDYGIELSGGAKATITGNTITDCLGVADDGSTSAGISVTEHFGPGTEATINNNTFIDNRYGVYVGFGVGDESTVTAENNTFENNKYQFRALENTDVDLEAVLANNTFEPDSVIFENTIIAKAFLEGKIYGYNSEVTSVDSEQGYAAVTAVVNDFFGEPVTGLEAEDFAWRNENEVLPFPDGQGPFTLDIDTFNEVEPGVYSWVIETDELETTREWDVWAYCAIEEEMVKIKENLLLLITNYEPEVDADNSSASWENNEDGTGTMTLTVHDQMDNPMPGFTETDIVVEYGGTPRDLDEMEALPLWDAVTLDDKGDGQYEILFDRAGSEDWSNGLVWTIKVAEVAIEVFEIDDLTVTFD